MTEIYYFLGISSWLRRVKEMMPANEVGKSVSYNE